MASLNGVEVKSLKEYAGHEGEPLLQGTVYYKGNKLGFWSQDARGGSDNFDFREDVLEESVLKVKAVQEGKYASYYSTDSFMADLVTLALLEKEYKKMVKKGYPILLAGFTWGTGTYSAIGFKSEKAITNEHKSKVVSEVLKYAYDKTEKVEVAIFKSLLDFEIVRGDETGLKKEKNKLIKEKQEAQKKYAMEEQERENKKNTLERRNNGRFVVTQNSGPNCTITDTRTNRSVTVGLYASKDVYESLIELFC